MNADTAYGIIYGLIAVIVIIVAIVIGQWTITSQIQTLGVFTIEDVVYTCTIKGEQ